MPQPPQQTTQNAGKRRSDEVAQGGSGTNRKKRKTTVEDPSIAMVRNKKGDGKIKGVMRHGSFMDKYIHEILLFICACRLYFGIRRTPREINLHGIGKGKTPQKPTDRFVVLFYELIRNLPRITFQFKTKPIPPKDTRKILESRTHRIKDFADYLMELINACGNSDVSDILAHVVGAASKDGKRTQMQIQIGLGLMAVGAEVRWARKTCVLNSMDNRSNTVAGRFANMSTRPDGIQPALLILFTREEFTEAIRFLEQENPLDVADEETEARYQHMTEAPKKYHPNYNTSTRQDLLWRTLGCKFRDVNRRELTGVYCTSIIHSDNPAEDEYCLVITYPLKKPET